MRFTLFFSFTLILCQEIWGVKADSVIVREKQIQILEKTRFLYDILGQEKTAKSRFQQFQEQTNDPAFKASTYFFLGKIFDRSRTSDSAVFYYKKALKHSKEIELHLDFIYGRLIALKPESIEPISTQISNIHKIDNIYPYFKNGKKEHILQISSKKSAFNNFKPEFVSLNAKAELHPLSLPIDQGEMLVDVCSDFFLSTDQKSLRFHRFPSSSQKKISSIKTDIIKGSILSCEGEEFVIIFPNQIEYYNHKTLKKSTPITNACKFNHLEKAKSTAIITCHDTLLSALNFKTGQEFKLQAENQRPFFITSGHSLLVVQYADVFSVYGGANYQNVLWKSNSKITDKIYLTEEELVLIDEKGNVTIRNNLTGERIWRKPLGAKGFTKMQKGLSFLTHYNACVGTDLAGRINWTYEFGWENETVPLYSKEFIVFFHPNGTLLKLNTNLMKIYSKTTKAILGDHLSNFSKDKCYDIIKYAETVINREPGNGLAWKLKYKCMEALKNPESEQLLALTRASKSYVTPPLKSSSLLNSLNNKLKSKWIWKRAYGPKFYPHLTTHQDNLLYIENDNQTLVILDSQKGKLIKKIHVSEELDSKLCFWDRSHIIISSSKRIYFIPIGKGQAGTKSYPVKAPICGSHMMKNSLIISDWNGNLNRINISPGTNITSVWSVKISNKGLLINPNFQPNLVDVVDIQGRYFIVDVRNGNITSEIDIPDGTITDTHSFGSFMFAGYDNGQLICVDKSEKKVLWTKKFSDQIFSLSSNETDVLMVGTATKKFISLNSGTGAFKKSITINTSLINKPVITPNGYWIGTTEPALEKRSFSHKLERKFQLTGVPGNPVISDSLIFISTIDGFINAFKLNK